MCDIDSGADDLLDLGDVSQDLEALSPNNLASSTDTFNINDISEDSAAEIDCYDNISSPGGSSTCSGPTYQRHLGFGPDQKILTSYKTDQDLCPSSPQKHGAITKTVARQRLSSQTSLEPRPKEAKKKKKKNLLCPSYEENISTSSIQIERSGQKINGIKGASISSRNRHKKGND